MPGPASRAGNQEGGCAPKPEAPAPVAAPLSVLPCKAVPQHVSKPRPPVLQKGNNARRARGAPVPAAPGNGPPKGGLSCKARVSPDPHTRVHSPEGPEASLLHVGRLHDVRLGRRELPGPEGEVPVATLEAVDHHGGRGPRGPPEPQEEEAGAAGAPAGTGSSASLARSAPLPCPAPPAPCRPSPTSAPASPPPSPPVGSARHFRDLASLGRDPP